MEQNGVLTLAGAGIINIILNGKPTSMNYEQLVTLLKSMPASRVERAEVMYNTPPAISCARCSNQCNTKRL